MEESSLRMIIDVYERGGSECVYVIARSNGPTFWRLSRHISDRATFTVDESHEVEAYIEKHMGHTFMAVPSFAPYDG
jgi:hypothetical protein